MMRSLPSQYGIGLYRYRVLPIQHRTTTFTMVGLRRKQRSSPEKDDEESSSCRVAIPTGAAAAKNPLAKGMSSNDASSPALIMNHQAAAAAVLDLCGQDDCDHDHPLPLFHRRRMLKITFWLKRSWAVRFLLFLVLVNYVVLYIRYFTMSRPSWLYGSPVDIQDVQACLVDGTIVLDPTPTLASSSSSLASSPSIYWEWHRFASEQHIALQNQTTTTTTTTTSGSRPKPKSKVMPQPRQRRLLIAQYSGYGKYAEMLDLVAPVNAAYAKRWGHDFVVLQGTAMNFPGILSSSSLSSSSTNAKNKCSDEPRSTFNKIPLLELAHEQKLYYDQLLILDTDAMIVDFDYDITTLLPLPLLDDGYVDGDGDGDGDDGSYLLAAHRVWKYDRRHTWDINAGITLWNLHHPLLPQVLEQWKRLVHQNPFLVIQRNDDQYFLQRTLMMSPSSWSWSWSWSSSQWSWSWSSPYSSYVYSLTNEFHYYQASVIRHFKRDARSWSTTSLEQRLLRIQETINGGGIKGCDSSSNNNDNNNNNDGINGSTITCQYPLTTKFAQRQRPDSAAAAAAAAEL